MEDTPANRFVVESFTPCYMDPAARQGMKERVHAALGELRFETESGVECHACPRRCKVDRLAGETGFCRTGRHARVSSAFAHMGEEDCLRGWRGSGTIFFALCNLHCVFCQNWDISQRVNGQEVDASDLADLMLALQKEGCHNINLVTPEHVAPQAVEALALAIDRGLRLPVVYNTSAYDSLSSLRLLDGLVDIYMPDFKFWSPAIAARLVKAKDYPNRAREAISEMHRQVGDLRFTPDGVACRGLLVRQLVMPEMLEESRAIFRWLSEEVSPDTHINIMAQYRPAHEVGTKDESGHGQASVRFAEINRPLGARELEEAYDSARAAGLWRFDERRPTEPR